MDGDKTEGTLLADLKRLHEELQELGQRVKIAADQNTQTNNGPDGNDIVVRGK